MAFEELIFHKSPFWLHVFCLPPNQLTTQNAKTIGDFIGNFFNIDFVHEGLSGNSHILILETMANIVKPSITSFHSKWKDGNIRLVNFKYEKLPSVSFNCGFIGHLSRNFQNSKSKDFSRNEKKKLHGPC